MMEEPVISQSAGVPRSRKKYVCRRVNIGNCWDEWERQRCLYGKGRSQVLFISHLLLTHRQYCREVQCQSADSNTSPASETVASAAVLGSGAENVVEESPHDDTDVKLTMEDNQSKAFQSAEVKQEECTNLMTLTSPEGDTKDIISNLQDLDSTPPLDSKLATNISSTARLIDATGKDNVSNLEDLDPSLSISKDLDTAALAQSSSMIETSQEAKPLLDNVQIAFDEVQFSNDTASNNRPDEESNFELEVKAVDEETDPANYDDNLSAAYSECDIKQAHEGVTFDEVQSSGDIVSAKRLDGESTFELEVEEVDEESDSAASGDNASCEEYDDGNTKEAQDHQDSDWEPVTSEESLSEEEEAPQPKTVQQPKIKTDPKTNRQKRKCVKKQNNSDENPTHVQKRKYIKKQNKSDEKPKRERKKRRKTAKPNICSVCSRVYKHPAELRKHFLWHTGERPFLCSICGRSYRTSSELNVHIRQHQGKTFECPHCKKIFISRPGLRNHLLIHVGVRSFVCSECGKSFLSLNNLKRHERVHTGVLPYKCDTCGKGFNQASNLTVHQRTHTGAVPFSCTKCDKGFKHAFSLRNHMKKQHDD